ncbi:DUF6702 family protein [Pseudidiomarina mangrovi]|uniref:DUF6702 family protein n=1 Tax=Pseudidiomarina mangrovi TaxID=2487133 RepID=UPI00196B4464|nr:DUF6702 family protein [Pseudidiomarina mangrovi]
MVRTGFALAKAMVVLLTVVSSMLSSAWAHQLHTASTTVAYNPRSGNIEVMHRFFLHDAEHAVKQLFDAKADIHSNAVTQQQFADYAASQFELAPLSGDSLALQLVGFQIDGRDFWVYQEVARPGDLTGFMIRQPVLQEIWSSQRNLVNVEGFSDALQSVTFSRDDNWLAVQW